MITVRDLLEAKRQPKGEASKSYVLLAAVQVGLENTLKGWKLNIDGVRGGERKGGTDESDDFTLYAYGPNREHILVNSSNNADEHVASADVAGEKHLKKVWERVGKGDAKKIVAWVLEALPKAGIVVQEALIVRDMVGEAATDQKLADSADWVFGALEQPFRTVQRVRDLLLSDGRAEAADAEKLLRIIGNARDGAAKLAHDLKRGAR